MTIACAEFDDLIDQLALGVLTGRDRAMALAHIDECHTCRAELASLSEVADEILLLAPPAPPDNGFAERVLAVIGHPDGEVRPHPRRAHARYPVRALVAAAATVIALTFAGVTGFSNHGAPAVAEMRTTTGTVVGNVSLRDAEPTLVDMHLPGWAALARSYGASPSTRYWLEIDLRDGSHQRVALDSTDAESWEVPTATADSDIASVRVVDEHGVMWCSARFT